MNNRPYTFVKLTASQLDIPQTSDDLEHVREVMELLKREGMWALQVEMVAVSPTRVKVGNDLKVLMSSYSYLCMSFDKSIIEAGETAGRRYSCLPGTRVMCGTSEIHTQLEQKVAKFLGREDAIVYSSTYMANISILTSVIFNTDVIVADNFIHQSLKDGCVLTGARYIPFTHARMDKAEEIFDNLRNKEGYKGKIFFVADSVYSMDGDILDLPKARALCDKYEATMVVDECHGLGVIGKTGRGVEEHYNMPGSIDLITACFSKSLGATGGFVVGNKKWISIARCFGRGPIFSVPLCAYNCGQAIRALEILDSTPSLVHRLQANGDYLRSELKKFGFDTGVSETAVIPLIVGAELKIHMLFKYLFQNGYFANIVVYPAVPIGKARLRLVMTVDHTKEEIDRFVQLLLQFEKVYPTMKLPSKL